MRGKEATELIGPLVLWLRRAFPRADPHLWAEAAHDAALAVLAHPDREYDDLRSYLRVAAARRLRRLVGRELRQGRVPEDFRVLGARTAPDTLRVAMGREALRAAFAALAPAPLRRSCTPAELWLLELLILRVPDADIAAMVLGLEHLDGPERRARVRHRRTLLRQRWVRALARARSGRGVAP